RVIAAGIKNVCIGIYDPNPDIYGEGEKRLKREAIEVRMFDPDLAQQIEDENAEFLNEQRERAERINTLKLKTPSRDENRRVPEASIEDISEAAVKTYLDSINATYAYGSDEMWQELKKRGFLTEGRNSRDLIPTVAGAVLFSERPHLFLPQSRIK